MVKHKVSFEIASLVFEDPFHLGTQGNKEREAGTLAGFRALFNGPLMGNCGYTKEKAEGAVLRGDADLVSFGRPCISNPDLVERFANGWPLNPTADPKVWNSVYPGAEWYTDLPRYEKGWGVGLDGL